MKIKKFQQGEGRRLCLLLNGWSAPPELFADWAVPAGADFWVAYDYRDLIFPEPLQAFEEVHLVAWSLGVWVATALWGEQASFASAIAINGTPFPIHAEWGIPPAVFEGTLQHLDADGQRRFERRMCGDRVTLQRYQQLPARLIEERAEELQALYAAIQAKPIDESVAASFWDKALVCTDDRIFTAGNQLAYWNGKATVEEITASHVPFYQPRFQQELQPNLWK